MSFKKLRILLTILHAICWVAQAWKSVKSVTIQKCFRKAGITTGEEFDVVCRQEFETDPFADLDHTLDSTAKADLDSLLGQVLQSDEHCSVTDCIDGDSMTPTCIEIDNEH